MKPKPRRRFSYTPHSIEIMGTPKVFMFGKGHLVRRTRYHARIDDIDIHLPYISFVLLWALCKNPNEWVPVSSLPCANPNRTFTTVSYLRNTMRNLGIDWQVFENNGEGGYRIFAAPACRIAVNPDIHFDQYANISTESEVANAS